ncbi:hypothetical protein D3C84_855270 [compost metagenome]
MFQALHRVFDVLRGGVFDKAAGLCEHFLDRGLECVGQFRDMAGEYGAILDGFDACIDGAAAFVPEHEDQGGAEHRDGVFEAGQPLVRDEVARDTYGEKIAAGGVERVLGGDAGVGATQYRHERVLAGDQGFSFILEVMGRGSAGNIALIAFHQSLQGLVGADGVLRFGGRGGFFGGPGDLVGQCTGQ